MIVISLVVKRILKTVVKDFCFYNILQGNYILTKVNKSQGKELNK